MGDELKDFTPEELEILGEKEPEPEKSEAESKDKGESKEPVKTEQAAEVKPESAPGKVEEKADKVEPEEKVDKVQQRIDRLTKEREEEKRKFDLFKRLGPDEYYRLYPAEKPEDFKPAPVKPTGALPKELSDIRLIKIEGGEHDGKTFGDIFDKDPRAAYQLDPYFARQLDDYNRDTKTRKETEFKKLVEAEQKRVDDLSIIVAKELSKDLYKTDDPEKLPEAQQKEIIDKTNAKIEEIIAWMQKTGRGHYNIDDAYELMNKDKKIASVRKDAAKNTLEKLDPSVRTISSGGDAEDVKASPYARYMSMTPERFAKEIEDMPDAKADKLLKEAPEELKKKFPSVAWYD